MEIETEIIVVIIASIASLIVGLINIFFNARISAKQNEIELKKARIELLETRRQKVEVVKSEISNRIIDLSDVRDFEFEKHFPRMVDFFQKNSSNVFSIGHLIDSNFIKELKALNKRINEYIAKSKQRIQFDNNEAKKDIEKMSKLGNRINEKLDESLQNIENEIIKLLK
ncbi:hypothetical protein QWY93_08595 [Echinicola jeungdonensis]|uniref:Uncharacterized protein n=1 Tax=Echinicola jeungdonensis TaxID=709343 RepID=A0ABV5J8M2_9BACT|nr:hypothetical protein [Echinicola jeungdonensis]MDN3669386.1 hypothetical protein [Echinicola jeungdonensis]